MEDECDLESADEITAAVHRIFDIPTIWLNTYNSKNINSWQNGIFFFFPTCTNFLRIKRIKKFRFSFFHFPTDRIKFCFVRILLDCSIIIVQALGVLWDWVPSY